jgi:hypothetical protein
MIVDLVIYYSIMLVFPVLFMVFAVIRVYQHKNDGREEGSQPIVRR